MRPLLADLVSDARFALRGFRRQPLVVAAACLVLALGVGANASIFGIAYGVLVRPLRYPESERLVRVWPDTPVDKLIADEAAGLTTVFDGVAATVPQEFPIRATGDAVVVDGARVGVRFFDVLRTRPYLGRTFAAGEAAPGRSRVLVLSHALWQRQFGGDPGVVGRAVDVAGEPFTVIGVLGPDFVSLTRGAEVWAPLPVDPNDAKDYLGSFYLELVARLRPGVTVDGANRAVAALARRLHAERPDLITDEKVRAARAIPLHDALVARARPTLVVLVAAVAVLLLTACANVANLLLARAAAQRRDYALRIALGARPGRIVRQVLTETLLLGTAAGALGVAFAVAIVRLLARTLPAGMPRAAELGATPVLVGMGAALAFGAALLAGALPARSALRPAVQAELQEEGRGGAGRRSRRTGRLLLVAQVAAATCLLIYAGLLLTSLRRLQAVAPGFDADRVLTLRLDPAETQYASEVAKAGYYARVLERVRGVPGVEAAGAVHLLPLTPGNWSFPYLAEGHPVRASGPGAGLLPTADFRVVAGDYFAALGTRLVAGRALGSTDVGDAPPVGLVNRALADSLWPDGGAVGRRIRLFGDGGPEFTIVGVVDDIRAERLDQPARAMIYRPIAQWPLATMVVVARTRGEPAALLGAVAAAARGVDPTVPVSRVATMRDVVRGASGDERFTGRIVAAFAALALVLAVVGIYGVLSHTVVRRGPEIAIRLALGAGRPHAVRLVLGEGAMLAAAGIGLGVLAARGGAGLVASRLYGVPATDPGTWSVAVLVVAATALVSCAVPAWRASAIAPMRALR